MSASSLSEQVQNNYLMNRSPLPTDLDYYPTWVQDIHHQLKGEVRTRKSASVQQSYLPAFGVEASHQSRVVWKKDFVEYMAVLYRIFNKYGECKISCDGPNAKGVLRVLFAKGRDYPMDLRHILWIEPEGTTLALPIEPVRDKDQDQQSNVLKTRFSKSSKSTMNTSGFEKETSKARHGGKWMDEKAEDVEYGEWVLLGE